MTFSHIHLACGISLSLLMAGEASFSQEPQSAALPHETASSAAIVRAPLLREGSNVVEVRGRIEQDQARGWWKLVIDPIATDRASHELLLLPCSELAEMQRIVAASEEPVEFLVTGRVFVFRGRNYVLPMHAPVVQAARPTEAERVIEAPPLADESMTEAAPTRSGGDSAADIMRDLERAAGPLTRRPTAQPPSPEPVLPDPPSWHAPVNSGNRIMVEESSVVNRRGRIARDSGGGWLFVFDADAAGLADPPVRLLPCQLLERMEDHARKTGHNAPALLSGIIYVHAGRTYLLPTVFRIPNERRNLTP